MGILKNISDNRKKNSFSTRLRMKRFTLFKTFLATIPKPIRIIDVGGTQAFWEMMCFTNLKKVEIILYNISNIGVSYPIFKSVIGDARDMKQFKDNEFDVVFSNSLIEHVGDYKDQRKIADEIKRVGKRYFIQTPNYYFPLEPHFLFPFFQYLPLNFRVLLLRHFNLGWYKKIPDIQKAKLTARKIRLLSKRELKELFPEAIIYKEKFIGLTKSFVLYRGCERNSK